MSGREHGSPPVEAARLVDLYFMEHRAKLIDIAAYLDRVDRAGGSTDFRHEALRAALTILSDGGPDRARRVLEALSDHSSEPIDRAPMQGAHGAPEPDPSEGGGAT